MMNNIPSVPRVRELEEESMSLGKRVLRVYRTLRISECAAALTFYTLLAIVPLLAFMFFGSEVLESRGFFESELSLFIKDNLGTSGSFVVDELISGASSVGENLFTSLFGLIIFLWSASNVFTYFRLTMGRVFRMFEEDNEGIVRKTIRLRLIAIVYMIGFFLLLAATMLAHVYLRVLFTAAGLVGILSPQAVAVLGAFASFVVALGFFTSLYFFIGKTLYWRDALTGGLTAAAGFEAANIIFSTLFIDSPIFVLYGGLGAFITFGMYLYYVYIIIFVGGLVARYHAKHFT